MTMYERVLVAILEYPGLLEKFLNGGGNLKGYDVNLLDQKKGLYDYPGPVHAVYSFENKDGLCWIKFIGDYTSYDGAVFCNVKQVSPKTELKTTYE